MPKETTSRKEKGKPKLNLRKNKLKLRLRENRSKLKLRKKAMQVILEDCQIPGMKKISKSSCIARQEALTGKRSIIRRKVSVFHKGIFTKRGEYLDPIGFCVGCQHWEQEQPPPTPEKIRIAISNF